MRIMSTFLLLPKPTHTLYVSFFINSLPILALLRQHARRRSSVHANHEHVLATFLDRLFLLVHVPSCFQWVMGWWFVLLFPPPR